MSYKKTKDKVGDNMGKSNLWDLKVYLKSLYLETLKLDKKMRRCCATNSLEDVIDCVRDLIQTSIKKVNNYFATATASFSENEDYNQQASVSFVKVSKDQLQEIVKDIESYEMYIQGIENSIRYQTDINYVDFTNLMINNNYECSNRG